jgi:hypothetical protein
MPEKPEHVDRLQHIRSYTGREGNLVMWGKLHISQTGRTVGGWLVDSWSENGAPYWQGQMHWFDRAENKFYHVYFTRPGALDLRGEDKDIDPKRAAFIRKMVDKWEGEWLKEEQAGGK